MLEAARAHDRDLLLHRRASRDEETTLEPSHFVLYSSIDPFVTDSQTDVVPTHECQGDHTLRDEVGYIRHKKIALR
ncbi:hypothetical protein B5X24_HaOG214475 [Helicoverpa armigera]|nr:hypothetical protein B5X24_HaOG214475 [Helicoverpa armigera]